MINRLKHSITIVDIAVPHDENLMKVEEEKQIKYLDSDP